MPPNELAQRGNGMTGPAPAPDPDDPSRTLRDDVVELARALPGELRRLTVRTGDRAIEVEWAGNSPAGGAPSEPAVVSAARDRGAQQDPARGPAAQGQDGLSAVRAPLVGTFYVASSPGGEPFVQVGDEVEVGQTLGIVEAMKLMNPIVADEAGVVHELLVGDAESVEYDQVLMHLRPSGRQR